MKSNQNTRNSIWSLVLTVALLFPAITQLVHQLEGHSHSICQDFDTHFHQTELECPIQDFHFNSFDLTEVPFVPSLDSTISSAPVDALQEVILANWQADKLLRGPPFLA